MERQDKGLVKRGKRKFTRILQVRSQQQKTTIFNYPQVRTDLGLPANARSVQITSAIATPIPRIPLKKYLLLFHRKLTKDIRYSTKDNNVKDKKIFTMVQKNEKLETAIRDLTKQLLQEKKASNVLLDQSKSDTETAVTEAYCIFNQAHNNKTTVEA